MFDAVQSWGFARRLSESQMATAGLSAMHLLGLTLVMGSVLVTSLRLLGWLFTERPAVDVARPALRVMAIGLGLSVITGALLFAPRAASVSSNYIFQVKMVFLALALIFQATAVRAESQSAPAFTRARLAGGVGLALWLGVALAGCAFILIE